MQTRKKIGLLGGSFNPAHKGHIYISEQALTALGLDEVWWLVNPLNPFKKEQDMLPFDKRFNYAVSLNKNPFIKVMDLESESGTRHTVDTLEYIMKKYPDTDFVWLIGDDLLPDFTLWKDWQKIVDMVQIAVFPRSLSEKQLDTLPAVRFLKDKGKWIYIDIPKLSVSASEIRKRKNIKIKGLNYDKNSQNGRC